MGKKTTSDRKKGLKLNLKPKSVWWTLPVFVLAVGAGTAFHVLPSNQQKSNQQTAIIADKKIAAIKTNSATSSSTASVKPASAAAALNRPIYYGRTVRVPILYYHYIGNNPNPADKARDALEVTPDKFDAQMGYLASNGYHTITFDTLYAILKGTGAVPSNPIILTFDDGYIDFYYNAYPILRKYNLHATSFIPTGLMDQGYYLHWSQIKEMDQSGLISFEAHSVNHSNLTALSADQVRYQVTESKKVLERQLGHPVKFMAYPYGSSNPTDWQIVKDAGYLGAAGTWYSTMQSEGTIFNMPRERIGDWDVKTFASKL